MASAIINILSPALLCAKWTIMQALMGGGGAQEQATTSSELKEKAAGTRSKHTNEAAEVKKPAGWIIARYCSRKVEHFPHVSPLPPIYGAPHIKSCQYFKMIIRQIMSRTLEPFLEYCPVLVYLNFLCCTCLPKFSCCCSLLTKTQRGFGIFFTFLGLLRLQKSLQFGVIQMLYKSELYVQKLQRDLIVLEPASNLPPKPICPLFLLQLVHQ